MSEELRAVGVWMPSTKPVVSTHEDIEKESLDPNRHRNVAVNNHSPIFLEHWIGIEHADDPALKVQI